MNEGARPATEADLPRIAELARAAIAELRPTKGGDVWARRDGRQEPVETSLAADLASDDHLVAVGEIDDFPVGYGVVRTEVLADGSVLGVIDDLYVEEGARAVGVGEVLMRSLIDWCDAQGCFGVDSLALPGNRATKNFFEAFGLVARAIVVHKRLGTAEPQAEQEQA